MIHILEDLEDLESKHEHSAQNPEAFPGKHSISLERNPAAGFNQKGWIGDNRMGLLCKHQVLYGTERNALRREMSNF
jgi:hypothetical protein